MCFFFTGCLSPLEKKKPLVGTGPRACMSFAYFFKHTFHQDRRLAFCVQTTVFFLNSGGYILLSHCSVGLVWDKPLYFSTFGTAWFAAGRVSCLLLALCWDSALGFRSLQGILARLLPFWLSQGSNNLLGLPCWFPLTPSFSICLKTAG